ncbi:MAG: hypothetical protein GY835_09935 [bacterium]|nr:hypothetical protein [bacterium]
MRVARPRQIVLQAVFRPGLNRAGFPRSEIQTAWSADATGAVTIAVYDRSFWVLGQAGAVSDDLGLVEVYLTDGAGPNIPVTVLADGSFETQSAPRPGPF